MSKKALRPVVVPRAEFDRMIAQMLRGDQLPKAIEKVMEWPATCPGPCFPAVFRSWMSHPAFEG